tara:strand:- start:225 stop:380 length:156 start_codon:yes stop_codon:yes gene_type:complete
MADKPKAAGSPTKKPWGTSAESVANKYKWSPAKKPGDTNKPGKSPTPNGGK